MLMAHEQLRAIAYVVFCDKDWDEDSAALEFLRCELKTRPYIGPLRRKFFTKRTRVDGLRLRLLRLLERRPDGYYSQNAEEECAIRCSQPFFLSRKIMNMAETPHIGV